MKKLLILVLVLIIVIVAGVHYAVKHTATTAQPKVASFEECVGAGYAVLESFPRQCKTPAGQTFTEAVATSTPVVVEPDVRNINVTSNTVIKSPLTLTGEARGNWFFEATLPIQIKDGKGKVIGMAGAQAKGEWMTNDYVPFTAKLTFTKPTTATGTIVISNDNPSGLPENSRSYEVPIRFTPAPASTTATTTKPVSATKPPTQLAECKPTGCSSQICSDQEVASTCEYTAEYACYRSAKCERQASGMCGWTKSAELTMCINNARAGANI